MLQISVLVVILKALVPFCHVGSSLPHKLLVPVLPISNLPIVNILIRMYPSSTYLQFISNRIRLFIEFLNMIISCLKFPMR